MYENQELIYQSIENIKNLNKFRGYESIYFFAVDERKPDIFKVGRTQDIIQRLRNYNIGRIKEVDLQNIKNLRFFIFCTKLK